MKLKYKVNDKLEFELEGEGQKEVFMERYKKLQSDMNELRKMDGPDTTNFVTDLIHYVSTKCCLRNIYWLDEDMKKMVRHEK